MVVHKSHEQSSEDYLKAMLILYEKTDSIRPVDLVTQIGIHKTKHKQNNFNITKGKASL